MRKLLLTILSIAAALQFETAFAQEATESFRPVAGDKVMTIGLNNNTGFWALKKYKTDKLACRFGVTGSYTIGPKTVTDGVDYNASNYQTDIYTKTEKSTQYSIGITGGFQKSIVDHNRIEPYMGVDLKLSYQYSSYSSVQEYQPGSSYFKTIKNEYKNPLALSLYLSPLVGLNYYIMPRLAIGAEYGINLVGLNYTANAETEDEYTFNSNTSRSNQIRSTKQKDGALGLSGAVTGRALITLTFYLK